MAVTEAPPAPPGRIVAVDVVRGFAVVLMIVYHLAWDLTFYRLAEIPLFSNTFWLGFRLFIPSVFLGVVGFSLVLAHKRGIRPRPFLRRLAILVACALAITAGSYYFFPDAYIFFGILHSIALCSVLALAFLRVPVAVIAAAAVFCVAAPWAFADPFFNRPALQWIGLMTYFPNTNDYEPVFPWFGAVLAGMALGRLALDKRNDWPVLDWQADGPLWGVLDWTGRHALAVYMLHQPFLLGLLYLVALGV